MIFIVCMTAAVDVYEVKGSYEKAVIRPRVGLFGHAEDCGGRDVTMSTGCGVRISMGVGSILYCII